MNLRKKIPEENQYDCPGNQKKKQVFFSENKVVNFCNLKYIQCIDYSNLHKFNVVFSPIYFSAT